MKIGVKTFDSEKFLESFEDRADFFEIMALQRNDYSFLKRFSLPFVIHAEHGRQGTNPADSSKREFNIKSVNFARRIADFTKADKIIVHPGVIEEGNKNCSLENAIGFFRGLNDERILVENIFSSESFPLCGRGLCDTPYQIKRFLDSTRTGFCFDVNHALLSGVKLNGDYSFVKGYTDLAPKHYHIGGQKLGGEDAHRSFMDSDLDIKKILQYYPHDAEITLETTTDISEVAYDLRIIRKILTDLTKN